jgi:hypothetical protein
MIRTLNDEGLNAETEFYLLRTFQFLSSNLLEFPTAVAGYIMKEKMGKLAVATRSNKTAEVLVTENDMNESLLEILMTHGIYNASHRVRNYGITCLRTLAENSKLDDTFASFLKHVLSYEEEIVADREYASINHFIFHISRSPSCTLI